MDLVKLLPQEGIPTAYLYAMLRYSDFPDEVKQFANGANVLHLNPERILEYAFPLPAPQLRDQYGEFAETICTEADALRMANENLRRTRDLLLPKLMTGELDVEDLDIDIGELNT